MLQLRRAAGETGGSREGAEDAAAAAASEGLPDRGRRGAGTRKPRSTAPSTRKQDETRHCRRGRGALTGRQAAASCACAPRQTRAAGDTPRPATTAAHARPAAAAGHGGREARWARGLAAARQHGTPAAAAAAVSHTPAAAAAAAHRVVAPGLIKGHSEVAAVVVLAAAGRHLHVSILTQGHLHLALTAAVDWTLRGVARRCAALRGAGLCLCLSPLPCPAPPLAAQWPASADPAHLERDRHSPDGLGRAAHSGAPVRAAQHASMPASMASLLQGTSSPSTSNSSLTWAGGQGPG